MERLCGGKRWVEAGEERPGVDEPDERAPGLHEPLVGQRHPAVLRARGLRQKPGPAIRPREQRPHPAVRLLDGGDRQQRPREPVELDPCLGPRPRRGISSHLGEGVEDAPLVPRLRPSFFSGPWRSRPRRRKRRPLAPRCATSAPPRHGCSPTCINASRAPSRRLRPSARRPSCPDGSRPRRRPCEASPPWAASARSPRTSRTSCGTS